MNNNNINAMFSTTAAVSDPQEAMILRAIVVSSSAVYQGQMISSQDRQAAFQVLRDFKTYNGRIPLCLKWILDNSTASATTALPSITIATKLYACEQIQEFLKHSYSQLPESERFQVRHAILTAARNLATATTTTASDGESRILSNKLASLLAAIMVRDFPQRWTTCIEDLFGGLWIEGSANTMGSKMCLEILKLVAEDCTDSDFNAKVRKNTSKNEDVTIRNKN